MPAHYLLLEQTAHDLSDKSLCHDSMPLTQNKAGHRKRNSQGDRRAASTVQNQAVQLSPAGTWQQPSPIDLSHAER